MDDLKTYVALFSLRGLSLFRKSTQVLKLLLEKHRGKLLVGAAVGVGAASYVQSQLSSQKHREFSKHVCFFLRDTRLMKVAWVTLRSRCFFDLMGFLSRWSVNLY